MSTLNYLFSEFSNVMIYFVKVARSFFIWLDKELQGKGWSDKKLCEVAGLQTSTLSMARSGQKGITTNITNQIAVALGYEPIEVAVRAGLVPPPKTKLNYEKIMSDISALEQQLIEQDDDTLRAIEKFGERAKRIREQREKYG